MAPDMRGSLHQFRIRRDSPSPKKTSRVRSASPARSSDEAALASQPAGPRRSSQARNAIPACDRCRSFKKKCSRTFPVCTLCAAAGRECSYSAVPATPEAEALQLKSRVQWLSDFINQNLILSDHEAGIESVETGSDLASLLGRRLALRHSESVPIQPGEDQVSLITAPSTNLPNTLGVGLMPSENRNPSLGQSGLNVQIDANASTSPTDPGSTGPAGSHISYQGSTSTNQTSNRFAVSQALPPDAAARRFVDAYFRNVNRAYPFVNQTKVLENLETLGDFAQRLRDSQSTLLYLVMSIGCTTLERAGQVPRDTAKRFEVAYAEIIQECLSRHGIESVQILMLLALYTLFDPAGTSAYTIVGIAARQAITIGLTSRPADEDAYPPAETELRHRLYWSIFALDRMMAVSQGLPVALIDEHADVPFPSLTVEEFASAERAIYARKLQTSRHVIQLRQLESRILHQIHFKKQIEIAELAPVDRRAKLTALRASIEDWYSKGCLMSPMEADNSTVHSSITWLSARYYYLLLLLYYPNHFNSSAGVVSRQQLVQLVQGHLQSTSALFQQRQLPLNCNTLYRLMPLCLILMHDFVATCRAGSWTAQSTFPFSARDEVLVLLSVLEAFPEQWQLAHRAAQMVRQFAGVISGGMAAFFSDETVFPLGIAGVGNTGVDGRNVAVETGSKESLLAFMKPCIAGWTSLMQEMLGMSTCFQFVEYPSGDERTDDLVIAAAMPPQPPQYQQQQPQQQESPVTLSQMMMNRNDMNSIRDIGVGDNEGIDYRWSALDLDFL